ncbi:hypothetical protein FVP14_03055 [Staphylococcus aureus]|uniref:Uncharacterized protein n=1 Tax=Staphylococcus aureus TaxID=1280 RepID=A0A5A4RFX8_STAAU|nr:hypothetical protein FVP14_03055 [Staphylococcus aureus]BBH84969.1 hypothetical protein [Staphylococcus aureus]CRI09261.1 conserved hypothetical protein [Staphylococcus aureus]
MVVSAAATNFFLPKIDMAETNQSIADTKLHNTKAIIANTINMTPFEILSLNKSDANTMTGTIESIITNIEIIADITIVTIK